MAVNTKTYFSPVGDYGFIDPELAFGTIYSFSQNGQPDFTEVPYDEYDDPPPGSFMYSPVTGEIRINPETPFLVGFLTVIYKAIGRPTPPPPEPPMVCENPTITASVISVKHLRFQFGAVGNYITDILPGSGNCGDTPIATVVSNDTDNFAYGPVEEGSYKACTRRDCGGGMFSGQVPSNTVTVVLPARNFGVRKVPADTAIKIVSITGIALEARSGSLPLTTASQEAWFRHENYFGSIKVTVQVKKNQQVVVGLYKNGPLVQFIAVNQPVAGNHTVTFNPISATPSDNLFVALDYT